MVILICNEEHKELEMRSCQIFKVCIMG